MKRSLLLLVGLVIFLAALGGTASAQTATATPSPTPTPSPKPTPVPNQPIVINPRGAGGVCVSQTSTTPKEILDGKSHRNGLCIVASAAAYCETAPPSSADTAPPIEPAGPTAVGWPLAANVPFCLDTMLGSSVYAVRSRFDCDAVTGTITICAMEMR